MYRIVSKKVLNPTVVQMSIEAPLVAKKAQPGQFIILRVDEQGERIPLTVAGTDSEAGTVKIIFQNTIIFLPSAGAKISQEELSGNNRSAWR